MAVFPVSYFFRFLWVLVPWGFLIYFWHQFSAESQPSGYAVLALVALVHIAGKTRKSYARRDKKRAIGLLLLFFLLSLLCVAFFVFQDPGVRTGIFYMTALFFVLVEYFLDKHFPLSDERK